MYTKKEMQIHESGETDSLLPHSSEENPHSQAWGSDSPVGIQPLELVSFWLVMEDRDTWAAKGMISGGFTYHPIPLAYKPSSPRLPFSQVGKLLDRLNLRLWPKQAPKFISPLFRRQNSWPSQTFSTYSNYSACTYAADAKLKPMSRNRPK